MNKKELAEQIYDKNISTIYKEHLEFNTRFKGEIIAAIIEAMGVKPEANLCLKQATDSVDTIDALVLDYITYIEMDLMGKLNDEGSFIDDKSVSFVFTCLRKAKERINERQFFLLKDILTKRVRPTPPVEVMGVQLGINPNWREKFTAYKLSLDGVTHLDQIADWIEANVVVKPQPGMSDFAEWLLQNCTVNGTHGYVYKGQAYTPKQVHNIYQQSIREAIEPKGE